MSEREDISDILADRERILMVAWALPNEGTLTEGHRTQAIDNVAAYLRRQTLTPVDVAKQIGKPRATTIGELIKHKWREGSDGHVRRLNMFIEQHARAKAASLADRFVTTTKVARDMLTVARLVRENKTMGLVLGPSGIGKSRCALAISEKYVGAIYISVIAGPGGSHAPSGLLRALAVNLGVQGQQINSRPRPKSTQLERVLDALRDSNRLLILDEASKLSDDSVSLLRDIHDHTGIPILLIATRDLHDRIVKDTDPDHGQLYSRFDVIHHLTEGYDVSSGGKVLHTTEQIRELYTDPPIRLSTDATRYLQGVANDLGRGSLRRCKMLVRNAARRARKRQALSEGNKVTITGVDLEWVDIHFRPESSEREAVKDRSRRMAGVASG